MPSFAGPMIFSLTIMHNFVYVYNNVTFNLKQVLSNVVNDKRVQLKPSRIPGSNYINASFIDVSLWYNITNSQIKLNICILYIMLYYIHSS